MASAKQVMELENNKAKKIGSDFQNHNDKPKIEKPRSHETKIEKMVQNVEEDDHESDQNLTKAKSSRGSWKDLQKTGETNGAKTTLKRAKANQNAVNKRVLFKKALEQATVSDCVENLCKYQCPKCMRNFVSRGSIGEHFKKTKHLPVMGAKQVERNDYLTKIIAHECKICSKKILCDRDTILSHMRNKHKMKSLLDYRDQENVKCDSKKRKLKVDLQQLSTSDTKICKISYSKEIGSFCNFSCTKCDYNCSSWQLLTNHYTRHGEGKSLSPANYVTKVTLHKCIVCGERIYCDNIIVSQHLRCHKITLKQYQTTHSIKNVDFLEQYNLKLKLEIQKIPVVPPLSLRISPAGSLLDCQVTKDTGNLSFFQCHICHKSDMTYLVFAKHLSSKHKEKVSYQTKNVVEARYHKCHICDKIVLCDNEIIKRHLRQGHGIKMPEYNNNHVLKNGARVFPSFKEYLNKGHKFIIQRAQNKAEETHNQGTSDRSLITPSDISSESEDSDCEA